MHVAAVAEKTKTKVRFDAHDWPVDRVDEAIGGLQSVVRTAPPNRAVRK